jgi:hypothetical protein
MCIFRTDYWQCETYWIVPIHFSSSCLKVISAEFFYLTIYAFFFLNSILIANSIVSQDFSSAGSMCPVSIRYLLHLLDFISSLYSSSFFLTKDSEVNAVAFAIVPF